MGYLFVLSPSTVPPTSALDHLGSRPPEHDHVPGGAEADFWRHRDADSDLDHPHDRTPAALAGAGHGAAVDDERDGDVEHGQQRDLHRFADGAGGPRAGENVHFTVTASYPTEYCCVTAFYFGDGTFVPPPVRATPPGLVAGRAGSAPALGQPPRPGRQPSRRGDLVPARCQPSSNWAGPALIRPSTSRRGTALDDLQRGLVRRHRLGHPSLPTEEGGQVRGVEARSPAGRWSQSR